MNDTLRDEFISEIEEMIESSIGSLLSLEHESIEKSSPHVQNIMRYLHSAKGGCSMFDFPKLSHGFHQIEDLFLNWVSQQTLPAGGLDYIFYFFDQAKKTLHSEDDQFQIANWGDPQPSIDRATQETRVEVETQKEPVKALHKEEIRKSFFRNSIQSAISSKISHHTDFNSELLAYVIDPDQKNTIHTVRQLRENNFLTKNFSNLTRSLMRIQEEHPDVIILSSNCYDFQQFNLVQDLQRKKIPIPIIIIDENFSSDRLKQWLGVGIKTAISNPQDLDLIIFEARSHARSYRSQKLLNESLNILIYQLGIINYPGQSLLPEQNLEELKEVVKSLIKAKKEFSDLS